MIANGSLDIVLAFSNVFRTPDTIKTSFEKNVDFWFEIQPKMTFFAKQNSHFSQNLSQSSPVFGIRSRKLKQCPNYHFLSYSDILSCITAYHHLYIRKTTFSELPKCHFSAPRASTGQQVLTKWSTHVDQNIRSDQVVSQLSVTIFMGSRTLLVVQKSLIQ